jgi:hypothetical protein
MDAAAKQHIESGERRFAGHVVCWHRAKSGLDLPKRRLVAEYDNARQRNQRSEHADREFISAGLRANVSANANANDRRLMHRARARIQLRLPERRMGGSLTHRTVLKRAIGR